MYDTPRAASIVATSDCILWRISRNEYKSIIIHSKFMRNKMYMDLIQNVEVTGKRLGSYLAPDAVEKLAISMEREIFNPNEVIIRQGNKGMSFFQLFYLNSTCSLIDFHHYVINIQVIIFILLWKVKWMYIKQNLCRMRYLVSALNLEMTVMKTLKTIPKKNW